MLRFDVLTSSFGTNVQPIFDVGQHFYPETLHRLYLVNAPMVFYGAWKVISSLIDPDTRNKIQVFVRSMLLLSLHSRGSQAHLLPLLS